MHGVKKLSPRARTCPICHRPCRKKGTTRAGTQRWYCTECRYSFTAPRADQQRLAQFREFIDYVTDTRPRRHLTTSIRTWDRDHAWCWPTKPIWQPTGEIHDQIFIDGTYIAHGWCVLTAATTQGIIDYQLCDRESKASYQALLARIPAPLVVVTDGAQGALAAIRKEWPTSRLQRCQVHIQRNIRRVTTSRPKIVQHKALYRLGLDLTRITTSEQAIAWQKKLAAFHNLYDPWLAERTFKADTPPGVVPAFAKRNKAWWYTHHNTRSIVRSLDTHVKDGVLFTYLDPNLETTNKLRSTTNPLEGGINAPLKAYLHAHRGLTEHHMLRAMDYYLYSRSLNTQPITDFATNIEQPTPLHANNTRPGPAEIDTTINTSAPWEDGLTIRTGWIRN